MKKYQSSNGILLILGQTFQRQLVIACQLIPSKSLFDSHDFSKQEHIIKQQEINLLMFQSVNK
jgi:hypothetical protein